MRIQRKRDRFSSFFTLVEYKSDWSQHEGFGSFRGDFCHRTVSWTDSSTGLWTERKSDFVDSSLFVALWFNNVTFQSRSNTQENTDHLTSSSETRIIRDIRSETGALRQLILRLEQSNIRVENAMNLLKNDVGNLKTEMGNIRGNLVVTHLIAVHK